VAVFGGAVAGAEAANQLAKRGFRVVIFDQNDLPYGKIEDGLPKWHAKLRDKEENRINEKVNHINIRFVPKVKLGRDVIFEDVAKNWGFSAILLATGAWRDRPLPIPGIEGFVNKGLYYQNPFVYWFNHYHEPFYSGHLYKIEDNTIVVGGGLASIDVVKILMIETVQKALKEKDHEIDMFTLERGIDKVLDKLGLSLNDLGIKGCTLFYRRRDIDMPLTPMPTDTPELLEKAQRVRKKVLENAQRKYLFRFEPCQMPIDMIAEGDRLKGLVFRKTRIEDGRIVPIQGSEKAFRSPLVISSIGSVPEPIPGIPAEGAIFKISDEKTCQIDGYNNVFALGNAVTGRGNINESLKHGGEISTEVMDHYLGWEEKDYENWLRSTEVGVEHRVNKIVEFIQHKDFMPEDVIEQILARTEALQKKAGYEGDYPAWVKKKLPKRLEDMLEGTAH